MVAGDLKGEEAIVIMVTPMVDIAKGLVGECSANGQFIVGAEGAFGKACVAVEALTAGTDGLACIWGRVEVAATAAAIYAGQAVMYGATGEVAIDDEPDTRPERIGTAMEDFESEGNGTIWLGLVG